MAEVLQAEEPEVLHAEAEPSVWETAATTVGVLVAGGGLWKLGEKIVDFFGNRGKRNDEREDKERERKQAERDQDFSIRRAAREELLANRALLMAENAELREAQKAWHATQLANVTERAELAARVTISESEAARLRGALTEAQEALDRARAKLSHFRRDTRERAAFSEVDAAEQVAREALGKRRTPNPSDDPLTKTSASPAAPPQKPEEE